MPSSTHGRISSNRGIYIEMGYRLMHVHMQQIIAHEGGNNFRTAHTGLRKQMKAEGWTPPEEDLD